MIEVEGLTKDYGPRRAINNLTFKAELRRNLRISWSKWGRQNHNHAYSFRIHATNHGCCPGSRI